MGVPCRGLAPMSAGLSESPDTLNIFLPGGTLEPDWRPSGDTEVPEGLFTPFPPRNRSLRESQETGVHLHPQNLPGKLG